MRINDLFRTFSFLILLALGMAACKKGPDVTQPDNTALKIRLGTSFGMCAGYCRTELSVDSLSVRFVESAWGKSDGSYPDKVRTGTITSEEWACLRSLFDSKAFNSLDTVIGCPDCADGGAEWLEIEEEGVTRRVTFEYGTEVPPIADLVTRLRSLEQRYKDTVTGFLYGSWDWRMWGGGLAGVVLTPDSVGYTQRLEFFGRRRARLYRADTLVTETTFRTEIDESSGTKRPVVRFADDAVFWACPSLVELNGDSLRLDHGYFCPDAGWSVFKRESTICR